MYSAIAANKRRTWIMMVVFFAIVLGLGFAIDYVLGGGGAIIAISFVYAIVTALISYYAGDRMALWSSGAREIKKEDAPELWRLVENLCIANGQPMPKVHVIEDDVPNAFATGRDPSRSSIAFTTGLIRRLDRSELEGVAAHELSHIKNYDIRVMTIVVVLVGTVAIMTDLFLRSSLHGGRDRRNGNQLMLILGIAAVILAPIAAHLIKLAVSRRREYLADASGALLSRYPEGLARALEKIASFKQPLKHAHSATAHLYISNPFGAGAGWIAGLFSTHPPVEKRVAALRQMGQQA